MRKTLKSALSVVLSAAMVLTMGSVGTFANSTSAKAAEGEPQFTAGLWSYGTFAGWAGAASGTVEVSGAGEYTITAEATEALDDLFTSDNGTAVVIGKYADLTAAGLGTAYQVVGKSIKVNDGEEIPWVTEPVNWDDEARLVINNAWNSELDFVTSVKQPIKAGDKISATFEVKTGDTPADPTETPSTDPSAAPGDATEVPTAPSDANLNVMANIANFGNLWDWNGDPQDETASVKITGYGTYEVSAIAPKDMADLSTDGALVLVTDLTALPTDYTIVGKTVKVNDTEYDWSKAALYDDNGSIRVSVVNAFAPSDPNGNPMAGTTISVANGDKITLVFEVKAAEPATPTETPSAEPTETPSTEPTLPPAQSYHAYLGFESDAWDFRNTWEDRSNATSYDFNTQIGKNGGADAPLTVTIEDATITANGTYSVKISGADLSNATKFNMLYFSTDIPAAMTGVAFSDIKVILDGTEVGTLPVGLVKKEVQSGQKKYYQIMAINKYGAEGTDLPAEFTYSMPKDSMELQFTVAGLDFEQDYSTKTYGAKKGATFTSGNFKYKVTKAATITAGKTTKGKVEVVGLSAAGKKKTSVSIGTSVKYTSNKQKATYTISSLGTGAFKSASKLKTVTLSKNIKSIKKDTFKNCKNLSKLNLKAKLSSVAKNSFKGCKKTIKVSGASAKINKANVKKLVKSGYKNFK